MVTALEYEIYLRFKYWAKLTQQLTLEMEALPTWRVLFFANQATTLEVRRNLAQREMKTYAELIKDYDVLTRLNQTPEALIQKYNHDLSNLEKRKTLKPAKLNLTDPEES